MPGPGAERGAGTARGTGHGRREADRRASGARRRDTSGARGLCGGQSGIQPPPMTRTAPLPQVFAALIRLPRPLRQHHVKRARGTVKGVSTRTGTDGAGRRLARRRRVTTVRPARAVPVTARAGIAARVCRRSRRERALLPAESVPAAVRRGRGRPARRSASGSRPWPRGPLCAAADGIRSLAAAPFARGHGPASLLAGTSSRVPGTTWSCGRRTGSGGARAGAVVVGVR